MVFVVFSIAVVFNIRPSTEKSRNAAKRFTFSKPLRDLVKASLMWSQLQRVLRKARHVYLQNSVLLHLSRKMAQQPIVTGDRCVERRNDSTLSKRSRHKPAWPRVRMPSPRRPYRHSARVRFRYAQLLQFHLLHPAAVTFAAAVRRMHQRARSVSVLPK